MERYLEIKITESGKVGDILRARVGLTKRQISQAKFRQEGICKNGKQCRVTEEAAPGDVLRVCLETNEIDSKQLVPRGENDLLQILYEDQDMLAVNKPAGMVTHPSGSHYLDSLSNQIAAYFRGKNEATRIRSIGRLDRETSGILLFARNQVAAARLQKQREKGMLQKTYLALVEGRLPEEKSPTNSGEYYVKSIWRMHSGGSTDWERNDFATWEKIDIPLAPDPEDPMKMIISPGGILPGSKNAVTYYKQIKSFDNATLVELRLETGRTHQIRVHMAGLGHPLLGDTLYNPKMKTCPQNHSCNLHTPLCDIVQPNSGTAANIVREVGIESPLENRKSRKNIDNNCFKRAALHAWQLTFYHPFTDEKITLKAPLPADFYHFLNENKEEKT